jgi:hypothetical protein
MLKKIIIAATTGVVLAASLGSAAIAASNHQPQASQSQSHRNFEKIWFDLAKGENT